MLKSFDFGEKERLGGIEAEFRFRALRVGLGFATRLLGGRLKRPEASHFVHDSLGVELALEAFKSAVDRLSFANDYFRHVVSLGLKIDF
jgi:hypothetical protein